MWSRRSKTQSSFSAFPQAQSCHTQTIRLSPGIYGATLPYCSRDVKQSVLGFSLQTSHPCHPLPISGHAYISKSAVIGTCDLQSYLAFAQSCRLRPPATELKIICEVKITIKYGKDNNSSYIKIIQAPHRGAVTESGSHIASGAVQKNRGYGLNRGHSLPHSEMTAWLALQLCPRFPSDAYEEQI